MCRDVLHADFQSLTFLIAQITLESLYFFLILETQMSVNQNNQSFK